MIVSEKLRKAVRNGIEDTLSARWREPEFRFYYETSYWYEPIAGYEVACTQDTEMVYGKDGLGYDVGIPHSYTVKVARTFNCPFAKRTFENVDHWSLKKQACAWLAETIENDIRND